MATTYPTTIDAPTNPAPGDLEDGSTNSALGHAKQHTDANDGIVALQTKVGVTGSAVTTTIDYLLNKVAQLVKGAGTIVNWVKITSGATGVNPIIEATGETNIGLDVSSNGTGSIILWAGSKARELLKLLNVASAVNEITVSPAATGGAPSVASTGDDTNVDLYLKGKGTGSARFAGTHDGWVDPSETWTYASATTITVPSGAASKYSVGDKIKLTQTTVKYFYVTGVADTVLTVSGGTDYTVANAAISANYYSKGSSPLGFPQWFNYTPTLTGWSVVPPNSVYRFSLSGRVCSLNVEQNTGSTSNTTTIQITLPITASSLTNLFSGTTWWTAMNNSVSLNTPGRFYVSASTPTLATVDTNLAGGAWTAAGDKNFRGLLVYEI